MHVLEQYFMLFDRYADKGQIQVPSEVSLEQVAEALYCTTRNAKLVLRKLSDDGLIEWTAGRGRGNRSRLAFLMNKENLLVDSAQRLAEDGDYKRAFDLLHSYGEGTSANRRFMEWLDDSFGLRKEQGEELDIFRLPSFKPIITLDPSDSYFAVTAHMVRQLFDTLVHYDLAAGRIAPGIAHYWESNEEATVWAFHLRKGILFHNGKELTADDVEYTVERMRQGRRNSWILRSLNHVEVVSARVIRFHLNKPNYLFLRFLCTVALSILPKELAGQSESQFWRRPIGTGPFMVDEWSEARLIMHANPNYYQGRPHLDRVDIIVIPTRNSIGSAMRSVDWQQLLCDKELRDITPENGWVQVEAIGSHFNMLTWNMKKEGPHQSADFRRAVDLLIDRNRMIRELGEYRDYCAYGFFTDKNASRHATSGAADKEAAGTLLRSAGYKGEAVHIYTYGTHDRDAEWVQSRCLEAGINVHVHVETMDRIRDAFEEADGLLHALVFPEAEVCLIENYEQNGSFVKEFLDPSLADYVIETIDMALACKEQEERRAVLSEIEARLREEAQLMFLLGLKFQTNVHPSFKGVGFNSLGWIDFKHVWR